ncbi:MAG: riboflavin synthase [Pyramidobacter sp.]|jgi:riboflavin synthase
MFTGLVEAVGRVLSVARREDVTEVAVEAPFAGELKNGDSVSLSGVCSTVTRCGGGNFSVQLTDETLRVSRFLLLSPGDRLNLERAMPVTGRFDGHLVAGHVDGVGLVLSMKKGRSSAELWLDLPAELMRYVVYKGSLCVDGVSLTVASVQGNSCSVAVIPETLARTTLGTLCAGKRVNIETDMIARFVERLLETKDAPSPADGGLTREKLAQMGW